MRQNDNLIRTSHLVVRTGLIVNRLFVVAVIAGLTVSLISGSWLRAMLLGQGPGADAGAEVSGLRWMMCIGLVMGASIDRLLAALEKIVESASLSSPFVAANASRLRAIGWALLMLQLLSIPAYLVERTFPGMGMGTPEPFFSVSGWMAVLMVFVLSRVFQVGSAMREELEGTI